MNRMENLLTGAYSDICYKQAAETSATKNYKNKKK